MYLYSKAPWNSKLTQELFEISMNPKRTTQFEEDTIIKKITHKWKLSFRGNKNRGSFTGRSRVEVVQIRVMTASFECKEGGKKCANLNVSLEGHWQTGTKKTRNNAEEMIGRRENNERKRRKRWGKRTKKTERKHKQVRKREWRREIWRKLELEKR
jgi:hypothetical protein